MMHVELKSYNLEVAIFVFSCTIIPRRYPEDTPKIPLHQDTSFNGTKCEPGELFRV